MRAEHSRALRLGAGVSACSEETLLARLERSRLLVSFDPAAPGCEAAAALIAETARRLPSAVDVASGDTGAAERVAARAARVDPGRGVGAGRRGNYDFHVHVGAGGGGADLYARPVRHGCELARAPLLGAGAGAGAASALGAMACAALAGAEIFKALAAVLPERGRPLDELRWCPVTLSDDPLSAPLLGATLELDVALVGLGAIGSASARIISGLPVRGRALLVDPERFGAENLGTYSLGTRADAEGTEPSWKVELAARALAERLRVHSLHVPVERLIELVDAGRERWPALVLSGLDSAQARRETQRLWPDRLIDGATGDTMCGLHDIDENRGSACLMCLFPARTEGPSAAERLAAATGLAPELLRYGDQPLRSKDVEALPAERRALLEPLVGKPVCGLARAVGLSAVESDGYMPSVPFVSQQAACLVVGRMLATKLGVSAAPGFVQYDALAGPQAVTLLDRAPRPDCYCRERGPLIERVREARRMAA